MQGTFKARYKTVKVMTPSDKNMDTHCRRAKGTGVVILRLSPARCSILTVWNYVDLSELSPKQWLELIAVLGRSREVGCRC